MLATLIDLLSASPRGKSVWLGDETRSYSRGCLAATDGSRIEAAFTLHPSYHLRAPFLWSLTSRPRDRLIGRLTRLTRLVFLPHPTAA